MQKFDYPENPFDIFNEWFQEAVEKEPVDPNAMALATVNKEGQPSVRMVLLKGIVDNQFTFFTNLESQKAAAIHSNPLVALCFYWKSLARQVRIEGKAHQISDAEADSYFSTRPVGSQIGAWASKQSRPLKERSILEESLANYALEFGDNTVPRPPHWSGFRVEPELIEFWVEQPFRLHDRILYVKNGAGWMQQRLYP